MIFYRAIAGVAFVALNAVAGLYDQPYAVIEAAEPSKVREEFTPSISQVDGKSTRNTRRTDPITPGKHQITVRFETARVAQSPGEISRVLDMDLEACTLYRIAAHRVNGTNWEPKVYSEPLGECVKKFNKKAK